MGYNQRFTRYCLLFNKMPLEYRELLTARGRFSQRFIEQATKVSEEGQQKLIMEYKRASTNMFITQKVLKPFVIAMKPRGRSIAAKKTTAEKQLPTHLILARGRYIRIQQNRVGTRQAALGCQEIPKAVVLPSIYNVLLCVCFGEERGVRVVARHVLAGCGVLRTAQKSPASA